MTRLVQRAEEGHVQEGGVEARRDARVIAREGDGKGMHGPVEPATREVVAAALDYHPGEGFLCTLVERLMQHPVGDPIDPVADGCDQRNLALLQLGEDSLDSR